MTGKVLVEKRHKRMGIGKWIPNKGKQREKRSQIVEELHRRVIDRWDDDVIRRIILRGVA